MFVVSFCCVDVLKIYNGQILPRFRADVLLRSASEKRPSYVKPTSTERKTAPNISEAVTELKKEQAMTEEEKSEQMMRTAARRRVYAMARNDLRVRRESKDAVSQAKDTSASAKASPGEDSPVSPLSPSFLLLQRSAKAVFKASSKVNAVQIATKGFINEAQSRIAQREKEEAERAEAEARAAAKEAAQAKAKKRWNVAGQKTRIIRKFFTGPPAQQVAFFFATRKWTHG